MLTRSAKAYSSFSSVV